MITISAMTADSEKRLEEILSGKAVAPGLLGGSVSKGREEPIESVELRQCNLCDRFEGTSNQMREIDVSLVEYARTNNQEILICEICMGELWECPSCDKLIQKPEDDYICGGCRGY